MARQPPVPAPRQPRRLHRPPERRPPGLGDLQRHPAVLGHERAVQRPFHAAHAQPLRGGAGVGPPSRGLRLQGPQRHRPGRLRRVRPLPSYPSRASPPPSQLITPLPPPRPPAPPRPPTPPRPAPTRPPRAGSSPTPPPPP